ncbi:hypothetical protein CBL_20874, partial [Carabus blaptoides fortunei]
SLSDEQLLQLAEQTLIELAELPLDNSQDTDIEDEYEEEPSEDISPPVDEVIEDEEQQDAEVRSSQTGKSKGEPNRKWKKREVITTIPDYDYPEDIIGDPFIT